jgi:hypothetical protein
MGKMIMTTPSLKTEACPACGTPHEFECCEFLPKIVPICDACAAIQAATWESEQRRKAWRNLFLSRCPKGYWDSKPEIVSLMLAPALQWSQAKHHGGLGLIGESNAGKSSAVACRLWTLEKPFLWWSGTEARDAATEAASAEKNREEARRRWHHATTVEVLVIDDISQGKMTEAWSSKLFDLLESRMGAGLPTFWTSQIPLERLRAKIVRQNGGDSAQADAISRRLGQHSLVLEG